MGTGPRSDGARLRPGAATGLAEVGVIGADGTPIAGSGVQGSDSFDNRTVTVTCGDGPTISVAGQQFPPTSITATATQLRTGAPVEARVCGLDASATLPAGQPEVVVEPGPAFSVDNLDLAAVGPSAAQRNTPLESTAWTANHRELTVTNSSADQLIVNPESTSIGWIATAPDGSELTPVVVNGWQQAGSCRQAPREPSPSTSPATVGTASASSAGSCC